MPPNDSGATPTRLLAPLDVALMLVLAGTGLAARLLYASGFGLGDDIILRHNINSILVSHAVAPDNQAYRFVWWLPTAFTCRLFGMSEIGLVLPITVTAIGGILLLYAFGKALWGRAGGVVAAVLLIVHPLDFAWSTMVTSDIMFSVAAAGCFFCGLRATQVSEPTEQRRWWWWAAWCLLFSYHAKVSAVLLGPALLFAAWNERRHLDRSAWTFVRASILLLGASAATAYAMTGSPIAPYLSEISAQGLSGPTAVQFHRLTSSTFWAYPRWLFFPDAYGHWVYHLYTPLLIIFGLIGWAFGLRSRLFLLWWLLFLFFGMQFNFQREAGTWLVGFRNLRHGHVWVYPTILLLTGYLVSLRARSPRLADLLLALLVGFGLWQSIEVARPTQVSFADRRAVCRDLRSRPPMPVYSDFQIGTWCGLVDMKGFSFPAVESFDVARRRADLAALTEGYVVTGGGREPYYGCIECIPRQADLDPAQWELLREFPGPELFPVWRPEPMRLWERRAAPSGS